MVTHEVVRKAEYPGAAAWTWDVFHVSCPACGHLASLGDEADAREADKAHQMKCSERSRRVARAVSALSPISLDLDLALGASGFSRGHIAGRPFVDGYARKARAVLEGLGLSASELRRDLALGLSPDVIEEFFGRLLSALEAPAEGEGP